MVAAVANADGAIVEALKVISLVSHHQVKGGDKMVCKTIFAEVSAGSSEFPMTGLWLKHNLFAQLIVSAMRRVDAAIGSP